MANPTAEKTEAFTDANGMRFGLSTLMGLVFVTSVLWGIVEDGSMVAFGIGFAAVILLMLQLISNSAPRPVTVKHTESEIEAHLVRNYLVEHGIDAHVDDNPPVPLPVHQFNPSYQVVVPPGQWEATQEILRDFPPRA